MLLDGRLTSNANAIIRLDATTIDLSAPKSLKRTHKKVVTILNEKGTIHSNLRIYYDSKINIKNLGAVVYNAIGKEIQKFRSGDFKDVAAVNSFSLYEESRIKYLDYIPTEYPYTMELFYETVTPNTAWIPFWRPLQGYNISTEKSTYDIIYSLSAGLNKKERNFFGYKITDRSTEGHLSLTAENIEAINPEELSPDFDEFAPVLMVAPKHFYYEGFTGKVDSWESLGQWIHDKLLVGRTELPEETKQMARNLVVEIDDPIEKARAIYHYVQNNTRYISVQVGIGGIQPITALEVDRVKYGDCKGLTNYTKALLKVVGIESNYTEVYARSSEKKDIDTDFPSLLGQANHVILNIPQENNEPIWLECTSQTLPFGFLGDFTDDRYVLSITPEGGEILRTPKYSAMVSTQLTTGVFDILADKGLVARVNIISKGIQYDHKFYIERLEKQEQDKYYKDLWGYIHNIQIKNLKLENDKGNVAFTEQVDFHASDYAVMSGELMLISPNVLNRNRQIPDRYRNRKLPLKIDRGFMDGDEYEINLPEGFEIEFIPENISIANKFGNYTIDIKRVSDVKLKYSRTFTVLEGVYPKEEYQAYWEFIREVSKNDNAKIVLVKK